LFREKAPSESTQSWAFYALGYDRAFESLVEKAMERWPGGDYLRMPLFYLCRHSLELRLKYTIRDVSRYTDIGPIVDGHRLMSLWNHLLEHTDKVGMPATDDYTKLCDHFICVLDQVDPDGERFRYPSSKRQKIFPYTRVELDGLVNAHFHLGIYCDGLKEMLEERW